MSGQLFFNGADYFESLLKGIHEASHSIELESYIFDFDKTGIEVLTALKAAASRGLHTRLLVDGFGSHKTVHKIEAFLANSSVQFHVYHPVGFARTFLMKNGFASLNRRNHRKVCIIDSHLAWVGSFNVSSVHLALQGKPWRDTAILIESHGAESRSLRYAFDRAWSGHPFFNQRRSGPVSESILLNCTHHLRRRRNRKLARKILNAKERIWITTPYFSPDHHLRHALKSAALRGIDVRIILPKKNDVSGMNWVNHVFSRALSRYGVKTFFYSPVLMHAKTVIVDRWATVGSTNFNHRSILHDLEADVVIHDIRLLKQLENQFLEALGYSEVLPLESKKRSSLRKVIDFLPLILRYFT